MPSKRCRTKPLSVTAYSLRAYAGEPHIEYPARVTTVHSQDAQGDVDLPTHAHTCNAAPHKAAFACVVLLAEHDHI